MQIDKKRKLRKITEMHYWGALKVQNMLTPSTLLEEHLICRVVLR